MQSKGRPGNRKCFLALPYSNRHQRLRDAICKGAMIAGFEIMSLDQDPVVPGATIQEAVSSAIARADCIIADVSERNPNVFFELGLAQAMGKGLLLIASDDSRQNIPFDVREFRVLTYKYSVSELSDLMNRVADSLREFRRFPMVSTRMTGSDYAPFFMEWEKLSETELENLCRELMSQLGFQRLEWGKTAPEIDLVAELPRKDPDGFEYRELWLVSMGLREPIHMFIDSVMHDPDYVIDRVLRYSNRLEKRFERTADKSLTLLLILVREPFDPGAIEHIRLRSGRSFLKAGQSLNWRLRIWDQPYLSNIISRFPHIGYKYFSDEGRIRSKTRKSYEDLYKENSKLLAQQAYLIQQLEEQKNRCVRAERDAVWKDISFAAAHKIGNPIFAIETDLNPLLKRIRDQRLGEAEDVVLDIQISVEKAKACIDQFKSLSRAQEIHPQSIPLCPILEDACKPLYANGIKCAVTCPRDILVFGDPERLGECFDELVANAIHWVDGSRKDSYVKLELADRPPDPLPSFLDTSKNYVLVHVEDNGCGIPVENKSKIFNAFFTTFEHGTGLGLALVRRILEEHGGGIIEVGVPGKGADFQVYLPVSNTKSENMAENQK